MYDRLSIEKWQTNFLNGNYDALDVKTQISAGWYDWFCRNTSLPNKTKRMGNIVKQIKSGGKVDLKNWYVWFKNNCPMSGPLYDDFRFANLETGDVQFTTQINCCWNEHRYAVFGRTPDGKFHSEEALFETDSVRELIKWFNTKW